jgi:hypothetical protein
MYGALIIELAQVAEQEHMQEALMARARAQARRERRRQLGPGRIARAWTAFWAPRDVILVYRRAAGGDGSLDPATGPARGVRRRHAHSAAEKREGTSSTSTLGHVPAGNSPRSRYCHAAVWFAHPGTLGP